MSFLQTMVTDWLCSKRGREMGMAPGGRSYRMGACFSAGFWSHKCKMAMRTSGVTEMQVVQNVAH